MTKKYLDEQGLVKVAEAINAKQDELVSGTNIKTVAGQSLLGAGDVAINTSPMIETTYAALKALRDNSQLVPGMQYRITDYVATVNLSGYKSANHPFDLIVIADTANKLLCEARACLHSGDTYFALEKMNEWRIWYDIDNNDVLYSWADTTNGKGVIYRMIDEVRNDLPYDFKGICNSSNRFHLSGNYGSGDASLAGNYETQSQTAVQRMRVHDIQIAAFRNWISNGDKYRIPSVNISEGSYNVIVKCSDITNISLGACCDSMLYGNCKSISLSGGSTSSSPNKNLVIINSTGITRSGSYTTTNSTFINCSSISAGYDAMFSNCYFVNCSSWTITKSINQCKAFNAKSITIDKGLFLATLSSCQNIRFKQVSYGVEIAPNVEYVDIDANVGSTGNYLQNICVHSGVKGSSSAKKQALLDYDLSYSTDFYASGSQTIIL